MPVGRLRFNGPGAHNMQMQAGNVGLQNNRSLAEIPRGQPGRDLVQVGIGQKVKRVVGGQKIADVFKFKAHVIPRLQMGRARMPDCARKP